MSHPTHRLPGCDGKAADAVSAYTQVKMEDDLKLSKFQNRNVQTCGCVYHDTNGQNHGPVWKTQLFFLNGICMVILWQDSCWKGNLRKFYWSTVGKRFPIGNVSLSTEQKDYSYQCTYPNGRQNRKHKPTWKILMKDVDLEEPTSFLDHVHLGCT